VSQFKGSVHQPGNRDERWLSASTATARWQEYGWHEPCKPRGLCTDLWAAGGEIPPADPALARLEDIEAYIARDAPAAAKDKDIVAQLLARSRQLARVPRSGRQISAYPSEAA